MGFSGNGPSSIASGTDVALNNAAAGDVLTYDATSGKWKNAAPAGASDATSSTKGIVRLTGDLGGTAASPTVPGLSTKLTAASNLSDLASVATARTNLGLGTAATQATSAFDAAGVAATLIQKTDANLFWDGTGSCPLRSTATSDTSRRVRWICPVSPLTTTGYALPGDVWEAVS